MSKKLHALVGLAIVGTLVLTSAPSAQAEVEPGGWTSYSPSFNVQERGCGNVNNLTFTLTCSTASGDQRAERRYVTYTSGTRQFEGFHLFPRSNLRPRSERGRDSAGRDHPQGRAHTPTCACIHPARHPPFNRRFVR